MLRHILQSLVLILTLANYAAAQETANYCASGGFKLSYVVEVEKTPTARVVIHVKLSSLPTDIDKLRWQMHERFAYVRLPEPLMESDLVARSDGGALKVKRLKPYLWEIKTKGQAEVELSYTVPLTHREIAEVRQRDAYEYPYLDDAHGMLVAATMFGYPLGSRVNEIEVKFKLPAGWRAITPWRQVGENVFRPANLKELGSDLIAVGSAGSWSINEIRNGDFVGTIAFAPGQDELAKVAVEPLRKLVEYELELFGRPARGRYMFLFGRPDGERSNMAGSPKTNSMTLCVSPRLAPHADKYLPHLVAHEFYHTWAAALFDMPDDLRWVNEGFTDYYAYMVPARLGLITWDEFAKTLGEKMLSCDGNPLHGKMSLIDAGGKVFFENRDAYNLVYDGGLLLAAWLDVAIRRQADGNGKTDVRSLDDLMRRFINDPRWSGEAAAPPTKADFIAAIEQVCGEKIAQQVASVVTRPYEFDSVSAYAELGIEVKCEVVTASPDLRVNFDGTKVVDMDPQALAHRIGIRPGDLLEEVNGKTVKSPGDIHRAWG